MGTIFRLAFLLLGLASGAAAQAARDPAGAMAFLRVLGDVHIEHTRIWRPPLVREGVEVATGSGFVVAASGLVISNHHVVVPKPATGTLEGEPVRLTVVPRRLEVTVGGGPGTESQTFEGTVIASDPSLDLAVVQVSGSDLSYLPFGDSEALEPGRPLRVLGFPFGRQVEVGRRGDPGTAPAPTLTTGSLSATRADEAGETRYLQTDAQVLPGNSGGPMVDDEGYAVGVTRMKLAPGGAQAEGAAFGVPINLVKDFLDASGLLGQLPVARLAALVPQALPAKGLELLLPQGLGDGSPSRRTLDSGDVEDGISVRIDRVATPWTPDRIEEAILGRPEELPFFAPGPATRLRHAERGRPPRLVGSALGVAADGRAFRVEYAVLALRGEAVVARFLGPPDALAFNLGLLRRALESLAAQPLLTEPLRASPAVAFVATPGLESDQGPIALPADWVVEASEASGCPDLPPPATGVSASPPGDYTVALRALAWSEGEGPSPEAVRACGGASRGAVPLFFRRTTRLGVAVAVQGRLVERREGPVLFEVEAPEAKLPYVRDLYERWLREAGASAR